MEVERKIDSAIRLVILTVSGSMGDDDLISLADEFAKVPESERDLSLLVDLRQADGRNVTGAGVRRLAARPPVLSTAARRAIVVPSDLGFGMARMYGMLRDDRAGETRVFRDYDEARRWATTAVL